VLQTPRGGFLNDGEDRVTAAVFRRADVNVSVVFTETMQETVLIIPYDEKQCACVVSSQK
jgi:hypothetical protein